MYTSVTQAAWMMNHPTIFLARFKIIRGGHRTIITNHRRRKTSRIFLYERACEERIQNTFIPLHYPLEYGPTE
jgi:hypothetical protein